MVNVLTQNLLDEVLLLFATFFDLCSSEGLFAGIPCLLGCHGSEEVSDWCVVYDASRAVNHTCIHSEHHLDGFNLVLMC